LRRFRKIHIGVEVSRDGGVITMDWLGDNVGVGANKPGET
jgi:hypothetical protein